MIISIWKKVAVLLIIFFFVGAGFISSTIGTIEIKQVNSQPSSRGYIQGLIDNASAGDTIYIPSGIYYENIIINKSISLVGEDKDTTIIDASFSGDVVHISSDWVNIRGFTIQKSGDEWHDAGIEIDSTNNTITENNIFFNGADGIRVNRDRNIIKNNDIELNSRNGIYLCSASNCNIVLGNTLNWNNATGINICGHGGNFFIHCEYSNRNLVIGNDISNNKDGIYLEFACFNFILKNNFIDNERDAFFENSLLNRWRKNYWNESQISPKIILGQIDFGNGEYHQWIDIDWRPAQEPYDIG